MMRRIFIAIFILICSFPPLAAEAVQESTSLRGDPPAPVAPAVITRDTAGHATVRAITLTSPLRVDGRLDDEVYQREQPFGGFIQVAPDYGAPQSERSDVWVTYDDNGATSERRPPM